ncbi:MAG: tRNA (adenosine(37)-N6)-threonylcarbamoyltransferase complex transferase subunit TsaD [Planctomycetes bacterium]|nr:tRNA (adenosine(37)-N6)-threonylcarbamoyltransferase complex transferase subunit TsaD [Planctomycetota bacterium]
MSKPPTIIFALESSCDDTSAALVADGLEVLSNVVAGQDCLHGRFSGVVPELASRAHIEAIGPVIAEALAGGGVGQDRIAAVAVTCRPGLIGSLLVGLMAAKTLAYVWGKPLIGVNHVHAHAYSPSLGGEPIGYPVVALVASGGHAALYHCQSPTEVTALGQTIDDAPGEAFDKVANILHLGYPGGPAVERMAREGTAGAVPLPVTLLKDGSLDFSFSGLKTAVLYHVNGVPGARLSPDAAGRKGPGYGKGAENLTRQELADIAASFQAVVAEILAVKCRRAVEYSGARSIVLGGGVARNSVVRARVEEMANRLGCPLRMPAMAYCTDNAAMIAGLAYHQYLAGDLADLDLEASPTIRV